MVGKLTEHLLLAFEQALADQDWISFRPNVFALQDLATKWIEIVKARLAEAQRADTVTEHIHQVLLVVVVVLFLLLLRMFQVQHRSHCLTFSTRGTIGHRLDCLA